MPPVYEKSDITVRVIAHGDLAGIGLIRNDAIEHSRAIWTSTPWTVSDAQAWFTSLDDRTRFAVVAVRGDDVLGYASCGPWREKSGYRFSLEDSVYVHADARGLGIGRLLLTALIDAARAAGAHLVVADIEAGNSASIALHTRFGFVPAGTLREVGTKFGDWLDLTIMTLQLDARAADPA